MPSWKEHERGSSRQMGDYKGRWVDRALSVPLSKVMRFSAPFRPLLLLLPLYAVAAAVPEQVRSLLETTHELSNLVIRDAGTGQHTTVSHLRKSPKNQMAVPPKYQKLPPNLFCKGRSSIMTGDDDLYNQPSTRGPPTAGQSEPR